MGWNEDFCLNHFVLFLSLTLIHIFNTILVFFFFFFLFPPVDRMVAEPEMEAKNISDLLFHEKNKNENSYAMKKILSEIFKVLHLFI